MESVEMLLLFDYYGELLTQRQQMCIDLRYNQDLSLGEIAAELGISRQGVFDNIARAESRMMKMEEKTGFVRRSLQSRQAAGEIDKALEVLLGYPDPLVQEAAKRIARASQSIEE